MGRCSPAAAFRKRLIVHAVTRVPDGQGGFTETWLPTAAVWASVEPVKGYEKFQAMQTATPVTHKVTSRFSQAVTTDTRLVMGDRVFRVTEALNRGEAGRFLDARALELKAVPYIPNTPPAGALRLEGGGYLLLEDGSKLLLETAPGRGTFLLEDGSSLLLESGGNLTLEA